MKGRILLILIAVIFLQLNSQDLVEIKKSVYENPIMGHYLSIEEINQSINWSRDFYETDPPVGLIHNIAEFEQMQSVLIRYQFGIPYSLIAAMSEETVVTTIVTGQSQENTVLNIYNSNGVNTDNCNFLHAPSDSYWTRDYGPWFVIDGNDEFGIVNFRYNRPRPNDDDIPLEVAEYLDINVFGMDIETAGGNYMTDGMGISASSDLIMNENPSYTEQEIEQLFENYLGINTYHKIPDPNNTYIDHIDCWGKFLDVDKVLLRSVPESHNQYDEIEAVAEYFEEQTSSYGTPYEVYRVYTPNNQPYTNSLILNDRVYVPITNSTWDDEAIASYEEAMPGYEVLGFYSNSWESTDALHCRTKGIADIGMLYIYHIPIQGEQPANVDIEINAEIIPYSGETLYTDSLLVYYKVNDEVYSSVIMTHVEEDTYTALIPAASHGDMISYYIHAADASGRDTDHPLIGAPDPHIYNTVQYPEIDINIEQIDTILQPDNIMNDSFQLSNIGGGILEYEIYTIETTEIERDVTGSYLTCSVESYEPGETTTWTFTVYNGSNDDEWLNQVTIGFPAGVSINSATDFLGGSGGNLVFDGTTGTEVTLTWFGETALGYGVIHDGETASAEVNVTIDPDLMSSLMIDYQISGDLYGAEPHSVDGQLSIAGLGEPADWISFDPDVGEVVSGNYTDINYTIDATSLDEGIYTCDMIITGNATSDVIIPVTLTVSATSSEDEIFPTIDLLSNYPNPFNPETNIRFMVLEDGDVDVTIHNMKGQIVKNLVDQHMAKGVYYQKWDGRDNDGMKVASGLYFYKLVTKNYQIAQKMLLLK